MVLDCFAKGLTYKQTAEQLSISIDTIRTYVRRIYEKLHVQSATEAVAKYMRSRKVDILADYYGQFTGFAIVENPQNSPKTPIFTLLRQKNAIGSLYVTTEK